MRRWLALGAAAIATAGAALAFAQGDRRSRRARAVVHPSGGARRGAHARPVRDRDDARRPARVGARPRRRRDGRPAARAGRRLVGGAPGDRPARRRRGAAARRRDGVDIDGIHKFPPRVDSPYGDESRAVVEVEVVKLVLGEPIGKLAGFLEALAFLVEPLDIVPQCVAELLGCKLQRKEPVVQRLLVVRLLL